MQKSPFRRGGTAIVAAIAIGLALPTSSALADDPVPTETTSGTIVYGDGSPAAGLRYLYNNVDCVTNQNITSPKNDHPTWDYPLTVGADGAFSFTSYPGQCYKIWVLDEAGKTNYNIEGADPAYRAVVNSGNTAANLKVKAKKVTVTLTGAAAGTKATPFAYGTRQLTYTDEAVWEGDPSGLDTWNSGHKAEVGAGSAVTFSAALGTSYTLYFEGDDVYYPQSLGGNASGPRYLNARQFEHFDVTADAAPQSLTYSLKKWGAAAKFTPKLTAKAFAPGKKVSIKGLPKGWSFSYAWYLDGVRLDYAWRATYTPSTEDAGGKLSVAVTAENPGYRTATIKSKAVRLAKASPTVKVKLAKRTIKKSKKGKLTVTVKAKGLKSPEGKVKVKVAGKSQTVAFKEFDKGEISITLPKLKKGTHKIKVTYLGSSQINKKAAKTVTLTVT